MNTLQKSFVLTMTAGAVLSIGGLQADACGLGDADFKVTASVLNVRSTNSTQGTVVKKLKRGDVVRPTELSADKAWAKIGNGQWVSFNYLEMIDTCTIPSNGEDYTSIKPTKYIVTASSLNVRKGPNVNTTKVGSVKRNDVVTVTMTEGNWLFVENMGWIHGDYAKEFSGQNNTAKPNFKETTIAMRELTVTANSLNVREYPTTDSKVVGKLGKGKTAMTNVESGDWYKIESGWVHKDYVDETIWSMNSNSTWDDILDAPPHEDLDVRVVSVGEGYVLNVRGNRELTGDPIYKLKNGTKVNEITNFGGVSYINFTNDKGQTDFGFVASKYLKY